MSTLPPSRFVPTRTSGSEQPLRLNAFGFGRLAFPAVYRDGYLPRLHRLGTGGLSAFRIGRPASPAVDGYLAPGPASFRWAPGSTHSAISRLSRPAAHFSGPSGFKFCWTTVMVVLRVRVGLFCGSESQKLPITRDNFPNELAGVCLTSLWSTIQVNDPEGH